MSMNALPQEELVRFSDERWSAFWNRGRGGPGPGTGFIRFQKPPASKRTYSEGRALEHSEP